MTAPEVYISHAWGGESDDILAKIVARLEKEKIRVVYDHKDLQYKGSISQFMEQLGHSKAVIIIISNKYLRSEYCMYELLKIYHSDQFLDRIFPIVQDEVNIAKSAERIELVKYWEDQSTELEQKVRELGSLTYIEGITDDLNLYGDIRKNIAKLTSILKDINTLNIRLHNEENFTSLVDQVKAALARKAEAIVTDNQVVWREKKGVSTVTRFVLPAILILLVLMAMLWPRKEKTSGENQVVIVKTNQEFYPLWTGHWNQKLQGDGAMIDGTIEISFADNKLSGLSTNVYADHSQSVNELYDMALSQDGQTLRGRWKSKDLLHQEGDFEWKLNGNNFAGYYTLNSETMRYTWEGQK